MPGKSCNFVPLRICVLWEGGLQLRQGILHLSQLRTRQTSPRIKSPPPFSHAICSAPLMQRRVRSMRTCFASPSEFALLSFFFKCLLSEGSPSRWRTTRIIRFVEFFAASDLSRPNLSPPQIAWAYWLRGVCLGR
jgi:hypothetical protein